MSLIDLRPNFEEGEIHFKWEENRIKKNKNVIEITTGPTGSGKSMLDLRKAEIRYKMKFKEKFPIENVCFSIGTLIKRISTGKLRPGEVLILEEAGVNAGSGDWQNKIVKMFNYVLQSFRSMNIIIYMNLPVMTMLAKQGRQLVHLHMETCGINFDNKTVSVKPLFHQLNQHSGVSYWKFLRVKRNKKVITIQRMKFGLPSKELRDAYEAKKAKFLDDLTTNFTMELERTEQDKVNKMARKDLSSVELETRRLLEENDGDMKEVAKIRGCAIPTVQETIKRMEKKGYRCKRARIGRIKG